MNKYLDLTPSYNHIIFQHDDMETARLSNSKCQYGVKGIHLLKQNFDGLSVKGLEYDLPHHEGPIPFDNLICDGQQIAVEAFVADRICFLGFCELGTVSERVVVYSEKAREEVSMLFKTFHTDSFQGLDTIGKNVDCIVASQAMGDDGQKHNLYYWECPITLTHPIVRIELPVNLSMHVMSILLKSPLPPS
ncbi:MAG: hypothetical protein ACLR23_13055 [Clostridia bacterium]